MGRWVDLGGGVVLDDDAVDKVIVPIYALKGQCRGVLFLCFSFPFFSSLAAPPGAPAD